MALGPALLAVAAAVAVAGTPAPRDPCTALRTPLPGTRGPAEVRRDIEAYRSAWKPVCDPAAGPVDLAGLLGDAEALAADVGFTEAVEEILRSAPPGAPSPLPGIRRSEGGSAEVDWGAFGAVAERGRAEDQRFWRGASIALDGGGEPAWLGPSVGGGPRCVRLGEAAWLEIAGALEAMETAGEEPYARLGRAFRASLVATLAGIASAPVCGCTKGDPTAGLEPLAAAGEKRGSPMQRALAKAAGEALVALRAGTARLVWVREAPGAPATGCRAGGP